MPAPEMSTAQIEQAVIDLLVKGRKYDELLRNYNEACERLHKAEKRISDLDKKVMESFSYKLALADGSCPQPILNKQN